MKTYEFDGVIIGGGHNALVLAGYMAKSGLKVAILERTSHIGGGLATEEYPLYPGFYHEYHAQFHRNVPNLPWFKDLELSEYGVEYIYPEVNNGMPFKSGKNLIIHADPNVSRKSIGRISKRDAEIYYEVYHKYEEMAKKIWFVRDYSPPLSPEEEESLLSKSETGKQFLEIMRRSAYSVIDEMFESTEMKALYLFLYSVRGYLPSPEAINTGFAAVAMTYLGNKAMLPMGGSRNLAYALAWMVTSYGGKIFLSSEVNKILIKEGKAVGVETVDGRRFMARKFVVSSVDPTQTFLRFVGEEYLDKDFVRKVKSYKYGVSGKSFGVLFALHAGTHEPPKYTSSSYDSMINLAFNTAIGYETPELVLKHLNEVTEGKLPTEIGLQAACPTLFDPTRAPPGKHVLLAWQFVPYRIEGEKPERWDEIKWDFLEKVIAKWAEYAPNLNPRGNNIIYKFPQTPLDVERHLINMREGDFHVGALIPEQLGFNRPFREVSNYRTPIKNLYITGASTHPTGNITGAPGYNTARVIAEDLGLKLWWNPPDPRKVWSELK